METRAILAVVLATALLILYQAFFLAPPVTPPKEAAKREATPAPMPVLPHPEPGPAVPATKSAPRPPQRIAVIEAPLYRAVISSEGGRLQEWTLHYRGEKALVSVGELGPRGLVLGRAGLAAQPVPLRLQEETITLGPKRSEGVLVMTGEDAYGVRVTQTVRFRADQYTIGLTIRLENTQRIPQTLDVTLPWLASTKPANEKVQWPTEVVWEAAGTVHREHELAKAAAVEAPATWAGFASLYYLTALVPESPGLIVALGKESADRVKVAVRSPVSLAPGASWEGRVLVYAGPKEYDRLKAHGLQGAIDFGGFPVPRRWGGLPMEWLGVPVLWVMHFFYRYIGNYGVAIVLLTVVTRVLFYPLTVKSMTSMKKMQAIQPQVNAIRAKHKNDPQRAQREMLDLYKKEGVNPMGGCLPMVVQIPIFYALYVALSVSVELQNAPFICVGRIFGKELWICDLAVQDPIYVLPILMGITMFVQQKMTPIMGDPRQAKMMLAMPIVFTFMFLSLPSGLVLYWTVSNVLQIVQQRLMNRAPARAQGRTAKDVARA